MTTPELLSLMRLISAMESAMLASNVPFPDYLSDEVTRHTFTSATPPASIGCQRPLGVNLLAQQHYFFVPPLKIRSESCNHARPSDNVRIEGRVSICKIAAGSGVALGLRTISGGSALGADAQPVSNSKVSASNGIAHRL